MALRQIEIYGSPILRQKAKPVEDFGSELKQLVQDMLDTVVVEDGAGLAAPQIGESQRVIVIYLRPEDRDPLMIPMVNPEILESGGESEFEEGCLSVPDIREYVTRPEWIRFRYRDVKGETQELRADGIMARVVQHEVDHLDGILFVDRIGVARRSLISGKLKQIAKEHHHDAKPLSS
jgi:peptide deformylase